MDPTRELGRLLLIGGLILVAAGAFLLFGARLPFRLGRLPGDIAIEGRRGSLLFPDCDFPASERRLDSGFLVHRVAPKMSPLQLPLMPERRIWTVSDLTARIRDLLAREFTDIQVEGEISNAHAAQSGHCYFTLKDAKSQIRCVCFRQQLPRLKFRPEDGLHVTVRGSISVYEARGEYQIYVEHLEPVGRGALQLAFEQLKRRLEEEGLFDPERKKPLPVLPRAIGLITSSRGAAVRDIVHILRRRFPNLHLILYPARVQGEGAADEIVAAIKYFNRSSLPTSSSWRAEAVRSKTCGHSTRKTWPAPSPPAPFRSSPASAMRPTSPSPISSPTCAPLLHRQPPNSSFVRARNSIATSPNCATNSPIG